MARDNLTGFPTPETAFDFGDDIPPRLSPQEQWKTILQWRAELDSHPEAGGDLNRAWKMIAPSYDLGSEGGPIVGKELSTLCETPLEALFALATFGQYPPPELLILLTYCLDRYFMGGGKVSLEEVFFGKPVSRTGNRASRSALQSRKWLLEYEFLSRVKKGMSRSKAAESVSAKYNGKPDADSILRMMRGKKPIWHPWERE